MKRGRESALAVLLAGLATLAAAKPRIVPNRPPPRVPVAAVEVLRGEVQMADASLRWRRFKPQDRLATGERVRTDDEAVALVRLPWMTLLMGPATVLGVSQAGVLSTSLESGRLEQRGERGIVKLDAGPARIRGRGHLVVRRTAAATTVSVLDGLFSVESESSTLELRPGMGAVVARARDLKAEPLPPAPAALRPGSDPAYILHGQAVSLTWSPPDRPANVQVYRLDDRPLLVQDVEHSPARLEAPELGTYRWRVTLRDARGLEGRPSAYGAFCVVEK